MATRPPQRRPLKPLFPYYGGKGRLAPWIASLLPAHRVYVEPFAGSAAVLLAKSKARIEVINDLDGDIVNFYRVLRERPDDLARVLDLTPYARDEFAAARLDVDDIDDLERARRFFIRSTQAFGAVVRKGQSASWSISSKGGSDALTVRNKVARVREVADRLAFVYVEHRDAIDVVVAHDAPDVVFYLDPPYLGTTRRGGSGYAVEMMGAGPHERLAAVLNNVSGTVVLSGYPSPLYDSLYPGWHTTRREVRSSVSVRAGRSRDARRVEVLWSNRPLEPSSAAEKTPA